MTPAETIRNRRIAAGLTQAALAATLGIAPPRVSEWEHGRRSPSGTSAIRLARALGGTVEDYLSLDKVLDNRET